MTPKQKRIVERDLQTLFSRRAFIAKPTLEDIKRLDFFPPTVKYNRGTLFLSDKGDAALKRLTDLVCGLPELIGSVSKREIGTQVLKSYNDLIERQLQPTGQEFIDGLAHTLLATVKDYQFLIRIEGVDLKDQDVIELGSFRIQRSDRALLENIKFEGGLNAASVYEQFKDSLWLIGANRGSDDVASEQFEHRATLTVGILSICGAVLYKGTIWRSRVRAVISPLEHRKAISVLMWERGGDNPSLTRKWGREQDLPLDSKSVEHLTQKCFLKQLASLPEQTHPSELQDAIVRSVYWFADAYKDRNPTMQFVKLWTCAECFFAIDPKGMTDLNVNGFAATLTFAGFNIIDVKDYLSFKRRLEGLYDLRSKALHRASFGDIQTKDLDDLSFWVAWLIISMVSLSERRYRTLRQLHEQISRLDRISIATIAGPGK
jgi:Apea-like HEPN